MRPGSVATRPTGTPARGWPKVTSDGRPAKPPCCRFDKASGETRSAVIPNVSAATLRKAMEQELAINLGESVLHTDSWKGYVGMEGALKGHESVNHLAGEYVRGEVSSNRAEGYFSQLKRSIDGTHHHVSKEHLHRYLAQFDFLYLHMQAGRLRADASPRRQRRRSAADLPAVGRAGLRSIGRLSL
jgi:hypothetical protein